MKMIFAIVHKEDEGFVVERLNKEHISVTKLSSTGGFMRKGNTTLMIGTEDEKVDSAIQIIKEECSRRKEMLVPTPTYSEGTRAPILGYSSPQVYLSLHTLSLQRALVSSDISSTALVSWASLP